MSENGDNNESNSEFDSWLKKQEEKNKQRDKRLEASYQRIDKIKEKLNMSNPGKESNFYRGEDTENVHEFKNWLIDKENLEKIDNKEFKTFIEFTGGIDQVYLNTTAVLNGLDKLQDLVLTGKITKEEADILRPKFYGQLRNLTEKNQKNKLESEEHFIKSMTEAQKKQYSEIEYGLPGIENIESQREFVRRHLNIIENSNRDCLDFSISARVTGLEANLEKMADSVRNEVEARISLHDCYTLIRQAGGWIRRPEVAGPGYTIGSAANTAEVSRNHGLDRKKIVWLLTEYNEENKIGMPGLKVGEAWDYFQDLNDSEMYSDFIHKVNEKLKEKNESRVKLPNNNIFVEHDKESMEELLEAGMDAKTVFYTDSDNRRKEAVKNFIISELTKSCNGNYELARKSFQLAEKLTEATLETSVFNKKTGVGNDELGDIIGFQRWREGREKSGRDRGPEIHYGEIDGFGSSFLRFQIGEIEANKKILNDNKNKILARDILDGQKKLTEGCYSYFCAVKLGRIAALKDALVDRSPKPGSINKTTLEKSIAFFDLVDKWSMGEEKAREIETEIRADGDEMKLIKKEMREEEEKIKKRIINKEKPSTEKEKIEERLDKFEKFQADYKKYGDKKLRLNWIAGIVDCALEDFYLEWDANAFLQLKKAVTQDVLSKQKGTFLNQEDWDWIIKATNFNSRFVKLTSERFRVNFKPKF